MHERIHATCRYCGREYRFKPSAAGKRARCKECGEVFAVPPLELTLDDTIAQWLFEDIARETRDREHHQDANAGAYTSEY